MLDLSALFRYDSPLTFSYTSPVALSEEQAELGASYLTLPVSRVLFFGERGRGEFEKIYSLDLGAQYAITVWKSLEPYVKFTVTNVTNESGLLTFNRQIRPVTNGPVDAVGRPTTYTLGPNFGQANNSASFQNPREYFVSLGLRF